MFTFKATLPMPNEVYESGTVIASSWMQDDPGFGPVWGVIVTLEQDAPYYRVKEIIWDIEKGGWETNESSKFENVVYAVASYEDDYGVV